MPLQALPSRLGDWQAFRDLQLDPRAVQTLGATSYLARLYRKPNLELDFFTAYYAQQRAGENMHSPKNCLPGSGWEIWHYDTREIQARGGKVPINFDRVSYESKRYLFLYWYQSKRRIIANEYLGKILLVKDALLNGDSSGAIVRIMVPDQSGAADEAVQFAEAILPVMQRFF